MTNPGQSIHIGSMTTGATSFGANSPATGYVHISGTPVDELLRRIEENSAQLDDPEELKQVALDVQEELDNSSPNKGRVLHLLTRIAQGAKGVAAIVQSADAIARICSD
jgi:hypothetical protein